MASKTLLKKKQVDGDQNPEDMDVFGGRPMEDYPLFDPSTKQSYGCRSSTARSSAAHGQDVHSSYREMRQIMREEKRLRAIYLEDAFCTAVGSYFTFHVILTQPQNTTAYLESNWMSLCNALDKMKVRQLCEKLFSSYSDRPISSAEMDGMWNKITQNDDEMCVYKRIFGYVCAVQETLLLA